MLKKRLITALWGILLIIAAIWFDQQPLPWFTMLLSIWGVLAVLEFYKLLNITKITLLTYFGVLWTLLFILSPHFRYDFIIPVIKRKRNKHTLEMQDKTLYRCLYCRTEYDTLEKARSCIDKHDLVLVPIARNDLGRLNQFLYLKEDKLLTESLVRILQRYARKIPNA